LPPPPPPVAVIEPKTELAPSPPPTPRPEPSSEPDYYEGQAEDEEFFSEFEDEIMDNPFEPGTAEYKMIERRNDIVRGRGIEAYTYKGRQMEAQASQQGGGGAEAEQARIDAEREAAVKEEAIAEWTAYKQGHKLSNPELIKVARELGVKGYLNNTRSIMEALYAKGVSPADLPYGYDKPPWK
jgi:hypothetical protein